MNREAKLQDLMRLCYNAGGRTQQGFDDWWVEEGSDLFDTFVTEWVQLGEEDT